jgi:bifunctional N-acetylglucosamine-1-phosphate-uridyltransferase/glucosamine-1-phosphate-acetyltransferase GlmU-like protein
LNNCIQAAFSSGGGGGATVTTQSITVTDEQTTTSSDFVEVTNSTLTLATRTDGYALISTVMAIGNSNSTATMGLAINYDGANQVYAKWKQYANTGEQTQVITAMDELDGGSVSLQWRVSAGTGKIRDEAPMTSRLFLFEVS